MKYNLNLDEMFIILLIVGLAVFASIQTNNYSYIGWTIFGLILCLGDKIKGRQTNGSKR
jgi:uncharacterized membrane protein YccC